MGFGFKLKLKFIPRRQTIDEFQAKHDAETFFRRLRLKAHFHDKEPAEEQQEVSPSPDVNIIDNLFPKKSTWTPRPGEYSALDLYIDQCRCEISKIDFKRKTSKSNISKAEWKVLKSLKSRPDIVIKPADKGGRIVVWRKDLYVQEGHSQLNSPSYKKLDKDPTKSLNNQIINTVNEEINSNNLPPNAYKLYSQHPRTSLFYMLPKIHKANNPGRPIVSAVSCPTSQIATYLDHLLTPIVKQLPTYVFNNFRFTRAHRYLFTMDVKSLYTVIPHKDGLLALKHFLDKREIQVPPTATLVRLAELVLTTNAFLLNDEAFIQTSGVAMGSKLGPAYACLFVGHQELIAQSYDGPLPCLLMRYIDDIVGATSLPLNQLQDFINLVNNFHPALKFTHTITENSLPFLDTLLSISDDKITTSIHYKETDAHCYCDYNSSHPHSCKNSIPYSQFRRLRRLCSEQDDFESKTQ